MKPVILFKVAGFFYFSGSLMKNNVFKKSTDLSTLTDYTVINENPQPLVKIYKYRNYGSYQADKNLIFGSGVNDNHNLISYSYTRSMDDTKSKFTLRIKDVDYVKDPSYLINGSSGLKKNIFDSIETFDRCDIYTTSTHTKPDFIGIIHSKQISATIGSDGKVHKEISISGVSLVSLFNDFNINLSVIGTYATSKDAQDFLVKNNFSTTTVNVDGKIVLQPLSMKTVVNSIWDSFKKYADYLAQSAAVNNVASVVNNDLAQIIDQYVTIKCQNIECNFPISTNFFNGAELNFIQMLRLLFPVGVDEVFEQPGKLVIREKPFSPATWRKLTTYRVNLNKLIEYDFNQNDNEVYSVFMADIEGLATIESRSSYAKKTAGKNGYINVAYNSETIKRYGYKLCSTSFVGYVQNPAVTANSSLFETLDEKLKSFYENNHKMLNGRIKLTESFLNATPTIGEKLNFVLSHNLTTQTASFYINSETHTWNYGSAATVEYTVSRGGVYDKLGNFLKTPEYFSTALENEILSSK